MPQFDAIVIGTGQAGPSLARRLVAAGRKVAVIERKYFGGTCVNTGCTPTKTLVASAYAAHTARRHADYGVTIGGPIGVDMKAVKARKDAIVAPSRNGVERSLKTLEGCTVFQGHGRFVAPNTVKVGETVLEAPQIFINVGGRATVPAMPGLDQVPYLTNATMMDVDFLPEHLIMIGGSYIGLEFAQMYRRFGAQGDRDRDGAAADRARGRGRLDGRRGCSGSRRCRAAPQRDVPRGGETSRRHRGERRLPGGRAAT